MPSADISWWQAQSECISRYGTSLASITSDEQWQNAQNLMTTAVPPLNAVYIGLNDHNVDGEWGWIDGTKCNLDEAICTQFWLTPTDINADCGILITNNQYGLTLIAVDCIDIASDGYLCNMNACNMQIQNASECESNANCLPSELCHVRLDDGTMQQLNENEECSQFCTCYCIAVPSADPTSDPTPEPTPTCFPTIEPTEDVIIKTTESASSDSLSESDEDSEESESMDDLYLHQVDDIADDDDDEDESTGVDVDGSIANIFDTDESEQDEIITQELKAIIVDTWTVIICLLIANICILCVCYLRRIKYEKERVDEMEKRDDKLSDFTTDIDVIYRINSN